METAPVLRLHPEQAARLLASCRAYRGYLWQHVLPTPERNQMLRVLQTVQGRLLTLLQQGQTELALPLSVEEGSTVQRLCTELLKYYGHAPSSDQRTRMLSEVAGLRVVIEQAMRQTRAPSVRKGG